MKRLKSLLIRLLYILIILVAAILTGYRLKIWITDYLTLSSKFVVSSATNNIDSPTKAPTISICNINPVRGSALLSTTHKTGIPQDYELFVDSINGRINTDIPPQRLMRPIFQVMDKASHKLKDMLKFCTVGKEKCNHLNFTKSLLPTGACFTFNKEIPVHEDIILILDPEVHDYIIPNLGYAGFRVLIHSLYDPLWTALPLSTYVGPNFHTYIRINTVDKKYSRHCISHEQWIPCMHQCFEKSIFKTCKCYLMGKNACTFSHIMRCGIHFGNMKENVMPDNCVCSKRCNQVNYKYESITQSLKTNIFSIFLPPWSVIKHPQIKTKQIQQGSLIQLWAFLREANMTAFDDLRQLSIYLEKLIYFVNELEKHINIFQDRLLNIDKGNCRSSTQTPKKNNKIYVNGMEFVRHMKSSSLMKDLIESPLQLIHIHLVHLFFKGIGNELSEIERFIQQSDFITALSMFQYPSRDVSCVYLDQSNKNIALKEPSDDNYKSKDQTSHLQKLFLLFTLNFKKFKIKCEENVKYNLNIIQSLSNFSHKIPSDNVYGDTIVTLTVQMKINGNMAFQMESIQNLYDPQIAIIDILMSGLIIVFVFISLLNKCLNIDFNICKTDNCNNHRETTIQNNLSQKFNEKMWNQYSENSTYSFQSRDMESPITTFHLI